VIEAYSGAPLLVVIGGAPGAGKTTLSRRLAAELLLPRLGADAIGHTIRASKALADSTINTQWIAHDVLFQISEEMLQTGVSAILDLNLGWDFQWAWRDRMRASYPAARILPIVLRCPRAICLARIGERHASDPAHEGDPHEFVTNPLILRVWGFIEQLDRPDMYVADASDDEEKVYAAVKRHVQATLSGAYR
jgi:predicted kinase